MAGRPAQTDEALISKVLGLCEPGRKLICLAEAAEKLRLSHLHDSGDGQYMVATPESLDRVVARIRAAFADCIRRQGRSDVLVVERVRRRATAAATEQAIEYFEQRRRERDGTSARPLNAAERRVIRAWRADLASQVDGPALQSASHRARSRALTAAVVALLDSAHAIDGHTPTTEPRLTGLI